MDGGIGPFIWGLLQQWIANYIERRFFWFISRAGTFISFFLAIGVTLLAYRSGQPWLYAGVVGLFVLFCSLWTFGGIAFLRNQSRAILVKLEHDIPYALSFNSIDVSHEPENTKAAIQIALKFDNISNGPIDFEVKEFRVIIGDRTIPKPEFPNKGGFIPKGGHRSYAYPSFHKDVITPRMQMVVEFDAAYGAAGKKPSRRLKGKLGFVVTPRAGDVVLSNVGITEMSDVEFKP